MTAMKTFIKQYAVLTYFILTFVITWGGMVMVVGPSGFPITAAQFETAGPLVYLAMLVGPSVAGILMTALVQGKAGLRELLSRLLKWRVDIGWYAVGLLAAPLLAAALLLMLSIFSAAFLPAILASGDKLGLLLSGIAAGLMVGIFEELGWTGFAVPQLRRRYGVVTTGLIVGILWGAWHFVVFWESDSFSGAFPLALLLGRLFSWLPPFRILMVWVYGRTQSLLISMLMHASLVASLTIIVPAALSGTTLLTWILTLAAALWLIVAALAIVNGRQRSRQSFRESIA